MQTPKVLKTLPPCEQASWLRQGVILNWRAQSASEGLCLEMGLLGPHKGSVVGLQGKLRVASLIWCSLSRVELLVRSCKFGVLFSLERSRVAS